jgi:CDP-glycerol glycerophosphotransferase (TagB/SpsB family)
VRVTGNPRYDQIAQFTENADRAKIRKRFGVRDDKKVALIVSGNYNVGEFLGACIATTESMDRIVPIIKMHPLDSKSPLRHILKKHHIRDRAVVRELFEGLIIADVVITQLSTVAAEALLLGKKVVLVDYDGLKGWEAYTESRAFFQVNDYGALKSAIEKCVDFESLPGDMVVARDQFVEEYFHKMDGMASARVVDVIESLIE